MTGAGEKIGVFSFGRRPSARVPEKMLRPFGDTTLVDIALQKLRAFGPNAFFAGYEPEFRQKALAAGVDYVQRSEKSARIDEPITEILSFLHDVPYDYLLIVNACLPFLRVETIHGFLEHCKRGGLRPASVVFKKNNFFFKPDKTPFNFSSELKTINTKAIEPVYEFAHALYFFNKHYFFENGRYWDWKTLDLVEINDRLELLDIDTEEDFRIAEFVWKSRQDQRKTGDRAPTVGGALAI